MTRRRQKRLLALVIAVLLGFIALALLAKLQDGALLGKIYDFIKDTSLLIATVAAAYLANLFQSRQQFLHSLRDQWREIVQTKSALMLYCNTPEPSLEHYLKASAQLSECIDNMRIVYANVGETDELIGLYPYEPLHDMRRAFEKLDPRNEQAPPAEARKHAGDEIWDAFNAIREHFLDEFEIEEPSQPILVRGMRRLRKMGTSNAGRRLQRRQEIHMKRSSVKP
ncbi:MAG TPA: hypothetical protein VE986_07110 [Hyphomicrobiales bacterium]|nr:hypothetical protein [Hyphomicrobiales bacterium]